MSAEMFYGRVPWNFSEFRWYRGSVQSALNMSGPELQGRAVQGVFLFYLTFTLYNGRKEIP